MIWRWVLSCFPRPRIIYAANGLPYLIRWYLLPWRRPNGPGGAREAFDFDGLLLPGATWGPGGWNAHVHCFCQSDTDRALHSHPHKWAVSIILSGEYVEEREDLPPRLRGPGSVAVLRHDTFHRVELLTPYVWTLFLTGPKVARWGFRDPEAPGGVRWHVDAPPRR